MKVIGCVIALLVVIVGAIIIYNIINFCRVHFPDPTQQQPPAPNITNVVESAWFPLQPQLARQPASVSSDNASAGACDCGCSFSFQIVIVDGAPLMTNWFVPHIEDGAALLGQLDTLGVHNTSVSSHPPDIQQVGAVVTIFGAAPTVQVVIERSFDLLTWQAVQTNAFPMDKTLQTTMDGPCSNAFWRAVMP